VGVIYRLGLLSCVIPITQILSHYPITQPAHWKGQSLETIQQEWLSHCLQPIYWLNIVYRLHETPSLSVFHQAIQQQHDAAGGVIITRTDQQAPYAGTIDLKVLTWASLLLPFRHLIVHEKKKEVSGIGILLRESLKMENHAVSFSIVHLLIIKFLFLTNSVLYPQDEIHTNRIRSGQLFHRNTTRSDAH
jgi:hypothetical protein